MEITGYHKVFAPERRIYRIDRLQLPAAGVPVRAIGYFLVLALAALASSRAPGARALFAAVPWPFWGVIAPALLSAVFTAMRLDGRAMHLLAEPLVLHAFACALARRSRPDERPVRVDPRRTFVAPGRNVRYTGPGWIRIACSYRLLAGPPPIAGERRRSRRSTQAELQCLPARGEPCSLWVPRRASLRVTTAVAAR